MTLAAWLHDLSPWVLRLSPELGVRWYGLSYITGFVLAGLLLRWLARRRAAAMLPELAMDVIVAAVMGVIVGGRLGYVAFYDPGLLVSFKASFPFWGVLQFNRGGMASHGGMIGVILASFWIARRLVRPAHLAVGAEGLATPGRRVRHTLDVLAMITPPGLLLGRLANFINGELLGDVVAKPPAMGGGPAPWWAVRYPQEIPDEYLRRLGEIRDRASLLDEERWMQLEDAVRRTGLWRPGMRFLDAWDVVVDRLQHGGRELGRTVEPFLSARHPSQIYQAVGEGLVLGAVLLLMARTPRRPGVIGAMFLVVYGVLRIVTELWRLPDAQLAVQRIAGLSRGQWLSVAMIGAGLVALVFIRRVGGAAVGGWGRRAGAVV